MREERFGTCAAAGELSRDPLTELVIPAQAGLQRKNPLTLTYGGLFVVTAYRLSPV